MARLINHKRIRWWLGPAWIMAVGVGFLLGVGIGDFAVFEIYGLSRPHSVLLYASLTGFVVSIAEWLVIRSHVRASRFWILTGVVGWCLAAVLMELISGETLWIDFRSSMGWRNLRYLTFTTAGLIGGLMAGILQWLLLRNQYARSFWWIGASTANWAVYGALSSGYLTAILPASFGDVGFFTIWNVLGLCVGGFHWLTLQEYLAQASQSERILFVLWVLFLGLVSTFFPFIAPGIITGTALLWLIQQPQSTRAES